MGYRNIMGINKDEEDETNNMMWMWYWLGYIEIDKGILWEWRWGWYFEETKSTMGIMGILGGPTVTPMDQATYCSFAFRKPKGQRGHLSLGTPRATWSMDVTVAWSQLLRGHMMVYVSWMYFGSWVGVGRQKVGRMFGRTISSFVLQVSDHASSW